MRRVSLSLAAALLLPLVYAATDEAKGCTPVTVTVKEYEDVEPKTVYLTTTVKDVVEKWTTEYITVTSTKVELTTTTFVSTIEVTEIKTDVQIKPTTILDRVTETQVRTDVDTITTTVQGPTVTVVNTAFETGISIVTTTVIDTDTTTVIDTGTTTVFDTETTTVFDTDTTTVFDTDTTTVFETDVSTTTMTVVEEGPTVTVSDCPTSQPLTSLVLCTTRDVNPTYTPSEPLPTEYLWGCPPGKICTPPQEDCNFERSPPSDAYVCAPEECKPVPDRPDYVNLTWPTPTNADCAWRGPALGFFNLNPEDFGLSYAIFDVFGQPVCEATAPVWGDSEWRNSKPGKTRRGRRTNNPLARLLHRQVANAPEECYGVFDDANVSVA